MFVKTRKGKYLEFRPGYVACVIPTYKKCDIGYISFDQVEDETKKKAFFT